MCSILLFFINSNGQQHHINVDSIISVRKFVQLKIVGCYVIYSTMWSFNNLFTHQSNEPFLKSIRCIKHTTTIKFSKYKLVIVKFSTFPLVVPLAEKPFLCANTKQFFFVRRTLSLLQERNIWDKKDPYLLFLVCLLSS